MVTFLEARASLVNRCAVPRRIVPLSIAWIRASSTFSRLSYHHRASSASVLNFGTNIRSAFCAIITIPFPPGNALPAARSHRRLLSAGLRRPASSTPEPGHEADSYDPLRYTVARHPRLPHSDPSDRWQRPPQLPLA